MAFHSLRRSSTLGRYVEIAVRIAMSSAEYKLGLRARIKDASRVLFRHPGAVRAWQDMLLRLAHKGAHKEAAWGDQPSGHEGTMAENGW